MKFALALAIALNFWGERDVAVPCAPVTAVAGADAQMPRDQYGYPVPMAAEGCRVLISHEGAYLRVDDPALYCANVVHEVGHLAGLPHSETGLMAPAVGWDQVPYACTHWKRSAVRFGMPTAASKPPKPR